MSTNEELYNDCEFLAKYATSPKVRVVATALRERLIKERDGWKLAPIDPTQEMLDRGYLCIKLGRGAKSLWLEMMSAAPKE